MAGSSLQKESVNVMDRARKKSQTGIQGEKSGPEGHPVPGAGEFSAQPAPALAVPVEVWGESENPVMSGRGLSAAVRAP